MTLPPDSLPGHLVRQVPTTHSTHTVPMPGGGDPASCPPPPGAQLGLCAFSSWMAQLILAPESGPRSRSQHGTVRVQPL